MRTIIYVHSDLVAFVTEMVLKLFNFWESTLNNRFKIKSKSISFAPPSKVTIDPGDAKLITIQGRTPPHLRNSDVVLTANKYLAQHCPTTMIVTLHKGRTQLLVTNSSDKALTFSKGRPIAFLDTTKLVNVTEELPMDCSVSCRSTSSVPK